MSTIQDLIRANHAAPTASKLFSVTQQDAETIANRLALSPGLSLLFDDLSGHTRGGKWLTTSSAVFYCIDRTGRTDIEWHNVLMENRRDQHDITSVLADRKPRGNAARLGELPFLRHGGKVYYRVADLNGWLGQLPDSMRLH